MTELDPLQNQAVVRGMRIVRDGGAFKLLGKAGTGKTTTGLALVNRIMEAGYKVVCVAFTNKAVNRMREVGYPAQFCRTLNQLLYKTGIVIEVSGYQFTEDQADKVLRETDPMQIEGIMLEAGIEPTDQDAKDGHSAFWARLAKQIKRGNGSRVSGTVLKTEEELKKDGVDRNTVIVLDELSMCPLDAADELHGFFKSVIYIGDPAQLPPVGSVDTCKYLGADDVVELKTVHRVQGNDHLLDIIYSLDAGKIPLGTTAIPIETFQSMAKDGYQFICYTNKGVAWMNEEVRRVLGLHGEEPTGQEPLITVTRTRAERIVLVTPDNEKWFLENERRLRDQYAASKGRSGASAYNREAGKLQSVTLVRMIQKNMVLQCAGKPEQVGSLWILPVTVDGDREMRTWTVKTAPFWRMKQQRKNAFRKLGNSMTLDFAYAITAHKAQGSEWPKVAVMLRQIYRKDMGNEDIIDEVKRWNYTAATRGRQDIQLFTSIIGCPYG